MNDEISKQDFDLLIVGCGTYGLPLAAYAKALDKRTIHWGGGIQLLFGIKGKRWERNYHEINTHLTDLFNEYWVYTNVFEHPKNLNKVEGGYYL